jgi:redox-sensitive bicupin YhaK (pirin superfamily)
LAIRRNSIPFFSSIDFRNDRPEDYAAGFPWHPHRGIETITYVLSGTVSHGDSLGNQGTLGAGDVQWMTAGSGILHQEMPHGDTSGRMHGFQLWANLPSSLKMTDPRYQDVAGKDIPEITDDDGTKVRWCAASSGGRKGRFEGVAADPRYIDVWVPPGTRKALPVETTRGTRSRTSSMAKEPSATRRSRRGPDGDGRPGWRQRRGGAKHRGEPIAGAVRSGR